MRNNSYKTKKVTKRFKNQAFEYMDAVYNIALHLSKNRCDAEDLVQETYLKAYLYFDSFREGTNLKSWLFKILYNNFVNHYRRESRAPQCLEYIQEVVSDENEVIFQQEYEASENLNLREDCRRQFEDEIYFAVDRIPECYSRVLLLVDVHGLSYKEAAAILKCPLGTVMSRIFRARKMLRPSLKRYAVQNGYIQAKLRRNDVYKESLMPGRL